MAGQKKIEKKTVKKTIDTLLVENRKFKPTAKFKKQANANSADIYKTAGKNPVKFWEKMASELVWKKKWKKALIWKAPDARWFDGGKLNVTETCLDQHITNGNRNKAALIWEGEPGEKRTFTYYDIYRQVNKFANGLKSLGIKKGDRVAIYLPMIPEIMIAMLACARIGAVHSVVFGGFSPDSLRDRINDSECKLLITADGGYRKGQVIPLKNDADQAIGKCPSIEHVVVVNRGNFKQKMKKNRDVWYHELMEKSESYCQPTYMDSEDPLFILYTSGTTGKPKGIMHSCGGYLTGVYATTKLVFDLKPDDVFWCTADCGWVTGHSYIVYGPMANGATQVMYEGTPNYPDKDRFWKIVEEYGVSVFYTAPTAIRTFMNWGKKYPDSCDLSSLRLLGTVGEPINPEAWIWYNEVIGRKNCPIVDTWWQTETGHIMITPLPGITTTKPGLATWAFPGIEACVLDEEGNEIKEGGGFLAIKTPWPGMLRGIWGDRERFLETYWSKWKNVYFPGDGAKIDKEKYLWLLGRVDDVINISGHCISTMEVESALVEHKAVTEAAVVGTPHPIKGECLCCFVTLLPTKESESKLKKVLIDFVAKRIGAIAKPDKIIFTPDLPKTRSGKIMRRLLKDIAAGKVIGDTTTLADPSVLKSIKSKYDD